MSSIVIPPVSFGQVKYQLEDTFHYMIEIIQIPKKFKHLKCFSDKFYKDKRLLLGHWSDIIPPPLHHPIGKAEYYRHQCLLKKPKLRIGETVLCCIEPKIHTRESHLYKATCIRSLQHWLPYMQTNKHNVITLENIKLY